MAYSPHSAQRHNGREPSGHSSREHESIANRPEVVKTILNRGYGIVITVPCTGNQIIPARKACQAATLLNTFAEPNQSLVYPGAIIETGHQAEGDFRFPKDITLRIQLSTYKAAIARYAVAVVQDYPVLSKDQVAQLHEVDRGFTALEAAARQEQPRSYNPGTSDAELLWLDFDGRWLSEREATLLDNAQKTTARGATLWNNLLNAETTTKSFYGKKMSITEKFRGAQRLVYAIKREYFAHILRLVCSEMSSATAPAIFSGVRLQEERTRKRDKILFADLVIAGGHNDLASMTEILGRVQGLEVTVDETLKAR